jgi:hypothetical protein
LAPAGNSADFLVTISPKSKAGKVSNSSDFRHLQAPSKDRRDLAQALPRLLVERKQKGGEFDEDRDIILGSIAARE